MKKFLLDTCAVLWLAGGERECFSQEAIREIGMADALFISAITQWEISLKFAIGGIVLPLSPREMMSLFVKQYDIDVLPITDEILFRSTELPFHHKDPADRFIISTALINDLTVITSDRRFNEYGVRTLI